LTYRDALAETINGLYKAEIIHRRGPWKTRESVELATLEWVAWYNHERLMQPLGYLPRQKLMQSTIGNSPVRSQWRLDLNPTASALPGAVHSLMKKGLIPATFMASLS
jgi:transposase InsO family protein